LDWLWPDFLLLLGLIPLLVAFYIWILRRQCRFAVRYSSVSLVHQALHPTFWLRRHVPFLLLLFALISLVMAMGRPLAPEALLSGRTTIVLALDISRSMCMRDILPNRFEVAKAAALSFIQQPVLGTQVGVVAFAGFAELAQKPTTDLKLLENTLTTLTTATETAIGSAILRSLDAIAEVDKRVTPSEEVDPLFVSPESLSTSRFSQENYLPHIIVLLTDGASNSGPPPLAAAQQAAERGIRIYSIGFGTTKAAVMDCWNLYADPPPSNSAVESRVGGGSFGNGPDEATLKQIAEMTGGEFYSATSADELQIVFQELHSFVAMTNQTIEVTAYFAAIGTFLAMAAFLLSALWHPLL
jgi:Ca-activated chloride channel family protein